MENPELNFETLQEFFEVVKIQPFYDIIGVNAKSGIYHRMKGKGTNGQPQTLTDKDMDHSLTAMKIFLEAGQKLYNKLSTTP